MEHSRPLDPEQDLQRGVPHEVDINHAGGVNYIIDRPAGDGLPEVIRILDGSEGDDLPIYISSGEEDEFEDDDRLVESDSYDEEEEEEEEDWSTISNDSGYSTMTEDEDDLEDEDADDFDDFPPRSPLIQEFPPVPAPQQLMVGPPGPALTESAPSTSGLSSSTKRSREEDSTEEVSTKRPRRNEEEHPEEPAPSASGLSSFTNRSREEDYRDSAPSTSGLGPSTGRRHSPPFGVPGPIFGVPFGFPRWAEDGDSD